MKLTLIKAAQAMPAEDLADRGPANQPQGEPVARIRSKSLHEQPNCGIWECSPGKWRRAVTQAEFSHFVAGKCRFHADSGETLDIEAGDAVLFPPNTWGPGK
jgi:Predicted enzyme of the cupin superfamily